MGDLVRCQWDLFRAMVVPADAPPVQVKEMRRSFYGGIEAALRIQQRLAEDEEDVAVEKLESVFEECKQFAIDVSRGIA